MTFAVSSSRTAVYFAWILSRMTNRSGFTCDLILIGFTKLLQAALHKHSCGSTYCCLDSLDEEHNVMHIFFLSNPWGLSLGTSSVLNTNPAKKACQYFEVFPAKHLDYRLDWGIKGSETIRSDDSILHQHLITKLELEWQGLIFTSEFYF